MVELLDVTTAAFRTWTRGQPLQPVVVLKWVLCHLSATECATLVCHLLERQAVIFVVDSVECEGHEAESEGEHAGLPFYHRTQQGWNAIWRQGGFSNTTPLWLRQRLPYAPQGIFRITRWKEHLKQMGRGMRTRAPTTTAAEGGPNKRKLKAEQKEQRKRLRQKE